MSDLFLATDACVSACGLYRYWLTRVWDEALPQVCWVMLNPSTADATEDDPTVRRCLGFARSWGCGGIAVVNLFAFRATDPRALRRAKAPVGPENDRHIAEQAEGRRVVAAWGTGGNYLGRDREVLTLLRVLGRPVECLRLSAGGHPCHPLYLPASLRPVAWEG